MMDLEPLPPLTAAKPAVGSAAASAPRYVTGGAGDEVRLLLRDFADVQDFTCG